MRKDCFAYREEKHDDGGFKWTEETCDCLVEDICLDGKCPFFKHKESVEKYRYKYGNGNYGTGYKDKKLVFVL